MAGPLAVPPPRPATLSSTLHYSQPPDFRFVANLEQKKVKRGGGQKPSYPRKIKIEGKNPPHVKEKNVLGNIFFNHASQVDIYKLKNNYHSIYIYVIQWQLFNVPPPLI